MNERNQSAMDNQLAFFIGGNTAYNIRRLLRNLGSMISGKFNLDLITTDSKPLSTEISDYFNIYSNDSSRNSYHEYCSLRDYLVENSPSVITQLTEPPSHGMIAGMLAQHHGIPYVYRYSGDRFGVYQTYSGINKLAYFSYNNLFGRMPLKLANSFIVLGTTGCERLVNRNVPAENIAILPPAIDSGRFAPDQEPVQIPSVGLDQRVALFVGRLSRHKGIKTMERIIPAVVRKRPDIHFVFVGDPHSPPTVPESFADNVTIIGAVPPGQMPRYYARADLLIHPSLTEGLPLVIIEALLAETRVIASPVGDIPDITSNTFDSDEELKEMVCSFENLPIDSVNRYSCEYLASKYTNFYQRYI